MFKGVLGGFIRQLSTDTLSEVCNKSVTYTAPATCMF